MAACSACAAAGANTTHRCVDGEKLVGSKPDVIVPYAVRVLNAVRESTRDIPVVFVATSNPVGLGLVESLARPGGNLTGFMVHEVSLAGKLVTILKECAPKISRVALLASSDSLSVTGYWKSMRSAADIEAAIGGFAREPNGGIVLPPDATKITHRDVIIALTVKSRLPTIYSFRADVRRGGLISYGPNHSDLFRRAASYVDRILKGERPSDLPVQAPTTFEMAST